MRRTFGDILGERLHAEHRPVLMARALRQTEVAVTEVRSERPTHERSDSLPYDDAFIAMLQLRDFPRHEWWEDGRRAPTTALRAGHMTLCDLRRDPRFEINAPFHSIHFHLPRTLLDSIARESGGTIGSGLTYAPGVGIDDPVFRHLALSLQPSFARPAETSPLFVDAVTLAVATHVAATYGTARIPRASVAGGLSPRQRRLALELIESRLDGSIRIADLARHCGMTRRHFTQAFKKTTGVAPHRWLTERRVERAKSLLRSSTAPLSQIAVDCGFAGQSHFTRVFTALVGAPPGAWRRALL